MLKLLAIEDDLIFPEAYADNMRLPFDEGWETWAVFRQDGPHLTRIATFTDYGAAEQFIRNYNYKGELS